MTTWDPAKRGSNLRKRGVDLAMAARFEMEAALVAEHRTEARGERRLRAVGPIANKLFVSVFTCENDEDERAISPREADAKERRYDVGTV